MIQRIRQYVIDSYNGLYKIVIEPYMPTKQTVILLVVGLLLGMISAYVLYPTVYYNGDPNQLNQGDRDQWIKLVAASYANGMYDETAVRGLLDDVERPGDRVALLITQTSGVEQQALQQIQPIAAEIQGTVAPRDAGIFSSLMSFLVPLLLLVILTPIIVVVWKLLIYPNIVAPLVDRFTPKSAEELERRKQRAIEKADREKAIELQKQMVVQVDEQLGSPIMQKLAVYTKGRQFDDSFAIEDASEMFLGECGASKAKTLGDANELSAIEVWLFDKEDFVRTLTKVFCSEYAFNDPAIRSELELKVDNPATDLVLITQGAKLNLDTNALRVQGTVTSVTYGTNPALPPNSYFESIQIEIAAWQKSGQTVGAPVTAPSMPQVTAPMPAMAPAPVPSYSPPPQPMPSAPSFAPPPSVPQSPPMGGQPVNPGIRPLTPPPLTPQRPPAQDDDPFGGTGDFTPISGS